ncbi:stalk domain-containing protein [Paenibacillus sp. USHLN196]|uniref:stalk domain-containing protein n=1 Tax=Paenibacillus sp. USHLN196 TaxID=3081291 RepID=UPI0030195B8E
MKDKLKGLVIGILIGSAITGTTAFAATTTPIKAVIQKVSLYVDGTKKSTTDAITYKNTTYVPVRAMSNAIGEKVSLKGDSLYIGKQPKFIVNEDNAYKYVYSKIKKDVDKYKLGMMDEGYSEDGKYFVVRVYENHPEYIVTWGYYYVELTSGTVYKYDIPENKLIKL